MPFFIMVHKNVLRKLSDRELELYLNPKSRFVPEAIQMAFEILQERGKVFSDDEKEAVQKLIQEKESEEEQKQIKEKEVWQDYLTEDENAIRLFPRDLILMISFLLGTIIGSILLSINFIKLRKWSAAIITFIFGFAYLPFHNFLVLLIYQNSNNHFFSLKKSPEAFASGIGAITLIIFWIIFTPKKLPYRAASYIFPVVISLVMIALIFINPREWFSHYFLVNLAK